MPQTTKILQLLKHHYPKAKCTLTHNSAFQLLVATILSAQCTDKRVNLVTKTLFKKYKTANDYATAHMNELEQDIRSTGFYRNKAKNIQKTAQILKNKPVPNTMEELIQLPGVARKTANVLLGTWYKKNSGIVVDTHVARISQRLNLTQQSNPEKIEQDLMKIIPQTEYTQFSHQLIQHGRTLCKAQTPQCKNCFLLPLCPAGKRTITI
ncbi:endonuclease III [Candidatus Woesearchaeota archaeon]|nr:endonuclease III [Candidatus Woesearchaeota archaeon]